MAPPNADAPGTPAQSFTAVVGPNGSGKSNVIDAMLFVFGKRAKQLRLSKVSELIHKSENHRNLDTAKVTVFFHQVVDIDADTYEEVPDSCFSISRTAHKNNTSNYYLNDKKSNFTEITTLLKQHGVDLNNNRFLILQGEVEQISLMKPKSTTPHEDGLLEYLEDIIGTNAYIEPIEEGAKKLEELNENRTQGINRMKVTEKEREQLESAKSEAETFLERERDVLVKQVALYQLNVHAATAERDESAAKRDAKAEELEQERKRFKDENKDMEEVYTRQEAEQEACKKAKARVAKVEKEVSEFEKKEVKHEEDMKHLAAKLKKIDDKREKDAAKVEEAKQAAATAAGTEIPRLEAELAKAHERSVDLAAELKEREKEAKKEAATFRAELEGVREELVPFHERMSAEKDQSADAVAERKLLLGKQESHDRELKSAREEHTAASETLKANELALGKAEKELKAAAKDRDGKRDALKAAAAKEKQLSEALAAIRGTVQQAKQAGETSKSRGMIHAALLEGQRAKQLTGFHGRLGDLASIDGKYDVAVSTACGALDYYVVETTADAQKCVDFLRAKGVGVATFLILEKQRHLAADAAAAFAGNGTRLYDLISVSDDKFRVAFYYAMRNTLVADDLDAASKLAYADRARPQRVVTLKGELIETSGAMSGGGAKPISGRMRLAASGGKASSRAAGPADAPEVSREELAKMEQMIKMNEPKLREEQKRVAELEDAVAEAEERVAELEGREVPKLRAAIESGRSMVEELAKRVAVLEEAEVLTAADHKRLKELEKSIFAVDERVRAIEVSCEHLTRKAAELQERIDGCGGPKLKALRKESGDLEARIEAAKSELAQQKASIAAADKTVARLEAEVAKSEKEAAKLQAESDKREAAFAKACEASEGARTEHADAQAALEEAEARLAELSASYAKFEAALNKFRSLEIELEGELELLGQAVSDTEGKQRHWAKCLATSRTKFDAAAAEYAAARGDDVAAPGDTADPEAEGGPLAFLALGADGLAERFDVEALSTEIAQLQSSLAAMKPDMGALAAYKEKHAEYLQRQEQLEALTAERDAHRASHDELRKKRLHEFMAGFNVISLKLKELYQMITLGGDAELELIDSLDPFTEGIIFSVRPPKKSWKNIVNLSGGEKTLSSLALIFALHAYKPTPIYVMDEIDAALDFKNVSIIGHYIKDHIVGQNARTNGGATGASRCAQFVIISLRNNMFELSDRLVGIYKTNNTTKSITINPNAFAAPPGTVGA